MNDVYEGLKELLKPESIATHDDEAKPESFKTRQYCGICTWRSLLAFLSTKMTKDNYKKFICDIKLQSLVDKVESHAKEIPTLTEWHLIRQSHRKLSRTIAQAYEKAIIDQSYAKKAQAELNKVESFLNEKKTEILTHNGNPTAIPKYQWVSDNSKIWKV